MEAESTIAGDLLERDRECAALEQLLTGTRHGDGALALIEGGAGLGKSRLLRFARERAADRDVTPLTASGGDLEQEFAFGVVLQLFGPWLARIGEAERERCFAGAAGLAAPLFEPASWQDGRPPSAEHGLFHGLHWLAANIAEQEPLVLCVDDAHWADEASLRFLRYLAPRLADLPVALVLAYRPPGNRASAGSSELAALGAHRPARRLALAPLSREATAALARSSVADADESFAAVVWEATGGNPFFLHELLRAVHDGDLAARAADVGRLARVSPGSISRHVLIRLARLGDAAQQLAAAATVLGDGTPLRRATTLAELEPPVARGAADALVAEGIMTVNPGERLAFAHPLVREAILGDLPPVRRGRMHLEAARLLAAEAVEPEEAAAHLLAAPVAADAFAPAVLRHAAQRASARGAPRQAVSFLRRALEEPLSPEERAPLLLALASAEASVGDAAAHAHLDAALATLDDPSQRGRAQMTLGSLREMRGDHLGAAEAFAAAAEEFTGDERAAREALASYARTASMALVPDAFARVQRIVEQPVGDETGGELALLSLLATQRTLTGAPHQEVVPLARRAWAGGRLLEEEGVEGRSWSVLTGACTWNDAFVLSAEIGNAALAAARRSGSLMAYATASFCLAMPNAAHGRLLEALAHAEQALAAVPDGWEQYRFVCAWVATHARLLRGEIAEAAALLDAVGDPERADSADLAYGLDARGMLRLLQGRPGEALADHRAAGSLMSAVTENPALIPWRTGAALAAHRLGDETLARQFARESLERSRATGVPSVLGRDLRVAGMVTGGAAGLALLEESVALLAHEDLPIQHALSLFELGAARRRAGERVRARTLLAAALELAVRSDAAALVSQAQEELRAAGARPRRLVRSGIDALTPSELRVARMASEGLTNREIAQALFVTVHAVDKHLRAVYEKLSLSSRRELPNALAAGAAHWEPPTH